MAMEHLSEDLQRIAAWCCTHRLLINPDKTKLLLLGTPGVVTGARKYDHITPILKEIHWLPVPKQLEVRDTLMAFKCVKGLAPLSLRNKFTIRSQVHTRNTRNNDKLNTSFYRSATDQRSFSYRAAQLWNDLPGSLTNMESFNVFKNAIKGPPLTNF